MLKRFVIIFTLFITTAFTLTAQNNEVNVIESEIIAYDWDFNVLPDGTMLTSWNGPGVNGSGIATYFNVHDKNGQCKFADGAMLVDERPSKLYTTAKQLSLLDKDNNTIIAYQTLDNAVDAGLESNVNENYRVYKISPEGEMLWGKDGIDLNRGKYSESTHLERRL